MFQQRTYLDPSLRVSVQLIHTLNAISIALGAYHVGIFLLNVNVYHSYFDSEPPGTLVSDRYTLEWWFFAVSVTRLLVPFTALLMLTRIRETLPRLIHIVTVAALFVFEIVWLLLQGIELADCNDAALPDNFCNDPLYCCAPDVYSEPSSRCLNAVGCTPHISSADALGVSSDFWIRLIVTCIFIALDLSYLTFIHCVGDQSALLDLREKKRVANRAASASGETTEADAEAAAGQAEPDNLDEIEAPLIGQRLVTAAASQRRQPARFIIPAR
jgi:hypothetical protein